MAKLVTKDHAVPTAKPANRATLARKDQREKLAKLHPNKAPPVNQEVLAKPEPLVPQAQQAPQAKMAAQAAQALPAMQVSQVPKANQEAQEPMASQANKAKLAAALTAHQLVWLQVIKRWTKDRSSLRKTDFKLYNATIAVFLRVIFLKSICARKSS